MREAVVLVMVGLPARGKSFISNSLVRYLRTIQIHVKSFNAGNARRNCGTVGGAGAKADYFSASNTSAKEERDRLAMECCDRLLEWIYSQPSDVSCGAILDATNTTMERRRMVLDRCRRAAAEAEAGADLEENPPPLRVVFIESICDDPAILEGNYRMKLRNDDYKDSANKEEALADFKKRVSAYVEQYHPLEDREVETEEDDIACGLVRIINGGKKLTFHSLGCSLVMLNISVLLSCFHLSPRRIFLVHEFAADALSLAALLKKAEEEDEEGRPVDVLCRASKHAVRLARQMETLVEAPETGSMTRPSSAASSLNTEGLRQPRGILCLRKLEPRFGRCELQGLMGPARSLMQNLSSELPEETFEDLVDRLREVIMTIERLPRSLIVLYPEEEVLRVLLAHFVGCSEDEHPLTMPLPTGPVIELSRDHKGFALRESPLPAAAPTQEAPELSSMQSSDD